MVKRRKIMTPRRKSNHLAARQDIGLNLWSITQDTLLSMSRADLLALAEQLSVRIVTTTTNIDGSRAYAERKLTTVTSDTLRYRIMNRLVELREQDSKTRTEAEKKTIIEQAIRNNPTLSAGEVTPDQMTALMRLYKDR